MNTYYYHYSAKFEGEFLRFHGHFSTAWLDLEKVKAKAREHLTEKMKECGFNGSQLEVQQQIQQAGGGLHIRKLV